MPNETAPTKFCDLIMKGGITSGVIYPRLVAELAKTHQLKNIGGTSAGAIAAAGAAAAQYGRTNGVTVADGDPAAGGRDPSIGPFEKLDKLPEELGQLLGPNQSRLLSFFKPQDATRAPFEMLLTGIDKNQTWQARLRKMLWIVTKQYWWAFIIVPAAVWAVGFVLRYVFGQIVSYLNIVDVANLYVPIIGAVIGLGLLSLLFACCLSVRKLLFDLTQQNFGIASGMPPVSAKPDDPPTLTPWLTAYFNTLAGKSKAKPLTFGDLWGADPSKPEVDFQAVTTCLSMGRPYSMPFEDKDFYFSKTEWEKLFPEEIITWLVQNERASPTSVELRRLGHGDFYAMPNRENWPVVIAVRMSLSFPILLSAVPMYRVPRSGQDNKLKPIKVLFTDGGVSSNFPIHLFDSPFPSHPTFAVDLQNFPKEMTNEDEREKNRAFTFVGNRLGHQTPIAPIPEVTPSKQVIWFGFRLIETMQNWRDQLPKNMAGFRDRIAYVQHTEDEGGMNLNMDKKVIAALGESGKTAAQELTSAYYEPQVAYHNQTGWQNHQWIRMRTSLKHLDILLKSVGEKINGNYVQLPNEPAPGYLFPKMADQQKALILLKDIEDLAVRLKALQGDLAVDAPESKLAFRITPEW
jgi:predicted acylesterase/phospholipase RssA